MARAQAKSASEVPISVPMGGLNTVAAGLDMPATDCLQSWNLCAAEYGLRSRLGWREWVTGLDGDVRSLLGFTGSTADGSTSKLYACTETGIWNVSASTDSPSRVVTFGTQNTSSGVGEHSAFTDVSGGSIIANTRFLGQEGADANAIREAHQEVVRADGLRGRGLVPARGRRSACQHGQQDELGLALDGGAAVSRRRRQTGACRVQHTAGVDVREGWRRQHGIDVGAEEGEVSRGVEPQIDTATHDLEPVRHLLQGHDPTPALEGGEHGTQFLPALVDRRQLCGRVDLLAEVRLRQSPLLARLSFRPKGGISFSENEIPTCSNGAASARVTLHSCPSGNASAREDRRVRNNN